MMTRSVRTAFPIAFTLLVLAAGSGCSGGSTSTGLAAPLPSAPATSGVPSPSASSSTSFPSIALVLTPSTLSYNALGYQQPFVASESGYAGLLTATSSDCSGIATFSPASANGPNATFAVVSAAPGQCHVVIADSNGLTATESIDVTTTSGAINSNVRH